LAAVQPANHTGQTHPQLQGAGGGGVVVLIGQGTAPSPGILRTNVCNCRRALGGAAAQRKPA
jgi:hypothetical protein